jgi:hypothetical protein
VDYCLVQVCATGTVLNRVKAFTNVFSGNGGGALVAARSLLGAPLRCTVSCRTGSLRGESPILSWMCNDNAFGAVPFLEAPHLESRLGWIVVVDGWWCCLRMAADEVRLVHVGRKVQRGHGHERT